MGRQPFYAARFWVATARSTPEEEVADMSEGTGRTIWPAPLTRLLVRVMAVTAGMAVANLYCIQPLLAEMAVSLQVTQVSVGFAATLTQIGYVLGMLTILPMADIREKRFLIILMLCLSSASLRFMSFSWSGNALCAAAFPVGFTSIVPQLIVPLSAQLPTPRSEGRPLGRS